MVPPGSFLLFLLLFLTCGSGAAPAARGAARGSGGGCAGPEQPWRESAASAGAPGTLLHLRVRPLPPRAPPRGLLFPGKPLLSFVRRVYRCCQERRSCGSVRGIPGRLRAGAHVEFLLTRDVLALALTRAELHLRLSNPRGLDLRPVLPAAAKRGLATRFSSRPDGDAVELRVDLLSLVRRLQEAAADARAGGRLSEGVWKLTRPSGGDADGEGGGLDLGLDLDLGLGLECVQDGSKVSCEARGVQLSQTPFMVVYY